VGAINCVIKVKKQETVCERGALKGDPTENLKCRVITRDCSLVRAPYKIRNVKTAHLGLAQHNQWKTACCKKLLYSRRMTLLPPA
jgi:hypothetical protein